MSKCAIKLEAKDFMEWKNVVYESIDAFHLLAMKPSTDSLHDRREKKNTFSRRDNLEETNSAQVKSFQIIHQ